MNCRLIIFALLSMFNMILSVDIGSDSAVDRFTTQQILSDGDRVATFAYLKAGFQLHGPSVTGIFDSVFPVTGEVSLSGGTLSLSRDLTFRNVSEIETLGDIVGNNHIINLSSSLESIPLEGIVTNSCVNISFLTDQAQPATVLSCDWSYDDKFVAIGIVDNGFRIYEFNGSTLTLKDSETLSSLSVNDLSWHPTTTLLVVGTNNNVLGDEIRVYGVNASTGALTFISGVNKNVNIYAVDWHPSGTCVGIGQNDAAAEIAVYAVDSLGNIDSTPKVTYDAVTGFGYYKLLRWNYDGSYLAAGISNSVLVLKYSNDTFPSNVSDITVDTVGSIAWNKVATDFLAVGFLLSGAGKNLSIYEYDPTGPTLTERVSKSDLGNWVVGLDWRRQSNYLALAMDPVAVGAEFRTYCFDPDDYSLDQINGFEVADFAEAVRWSNDGTYVARGDSTNAIYVYKANTSFDPVTFGNVNIFLNSDVSLNSSMITFTGQSLIDGQSNCFDLGQTSTIVIGSNASLCFRDICVTGLLNSNIYCTDNTSTLSVDNCKWIMDSDYNFDQGHLEVFNDFEIIGDGYNFVYATDQESIITSNARLILDSNVTFSYAPLAANRDLINLYDDTSSIILHGATLFSTTTGLRLTKGNLVIERKSYLSCDGTVDAEAISFGDGTSSVNDLIIQFVGAANLEALSGRILYDNLLG